jgi:iron complex outermembrane receptor protein
MPTLNELYFVPGGNKDLKPEVSRNVEGGIESSFTQEGHSFIATANLYSRDVKNWIVWYGGSILTPHNIQQVWSRGLELDLKYQCMLKPSDESATKRSSGHTHKDQTLSGRQAGASVLSLQVLYSYTLSTTRSSAIAADYSIGKQIPYVPRYQLKMNAGFKRGDFDLHYIYAYTGYRFITTDESEFLLPYNTHNVQLAYNWSVTARHRLLATFSINNLLNKSYESITGRVMPGRHFVAGLHFRLKY